MKSGSARVPLQVRLRLLQQAPLCRGPQVFVRLQELSPRETGEGEPPREARKDQQNLIRKMST